MNHPGMINSIDDTISLNFDWSDENFKKIKKLLENYPLEKKQSAVVPVFRDCSTTK